MRLLFISLLSCITIIAMAQDSSFTDTTFWQETHKPYPVTIQQKNIGARSIIIDKENNVWIATSAGILVKKNGAANWTNPFPPAENGPAFCVAVNKTGDVFMGNWKGIYRYKNNTLQFLQGTDGPIASICAASEGIYAAGPKGIWLYNNQSFVHLKNNVGRSVRKIIS